jgi:2-(1,2-epoxy-1,2-dihydrophenyl)acetyl-CoA isomerase
MNDVASILDFQVDGPIARIRFNRPSVLNAIDAAMAQQFLAACRQIRENPVVRVVVLQGSGRAFMSGGDIRQFQRDPVAVASNIIDPLHAALTILVQLQAPVLASVHGVVAGAGLSLALACDLAISSDDARFCLAYSNVGTSCDGSASWSLPRIVGLRKALELALLNSTLDAAEALRLGMVNRVVPAAQLEAETEALAQKLAAGPPIAYGTMKMLMRNSLGNTFKQQIDDEREGFAQCAATEDFAEAIKAYFEKRPAQYQGK